MIFWDSRNFISSQLHEIRVLRARDAAAKVKLVTRAPLAASEFPKRILLLFTLQVPGSAAAPAFPLAQQIAGRVS